MSDEAVMKYPVIAQTQCDYLSSVDIGEDFNYEFM